MWSKDGPVFTITAVVPDVYNPQGEKNMKTGVFFPYSLMTWSVIPVLIKGHGDPEQYETLLRDTIHKVNGEIVLPYCRSMGETRDYHGMCILLKMIFVFLGTCAVGALAMAVAGLFGIISFSVNLRRRETGIRLAVGASPVGLVLLMARRGLVCSVFGLLFGALGAWTLRGVMHSTMDNFYDGWYVYTIVFVSVLAVSLLAVIIPSVRSVRSEPAQILRDE